ncbi:MAG TPA: hypothetical protein VIG47_12980 [Gemmatimonadaceae bacterium]
MTVGFVDDFVGGLGPDEGVFAVVPSGDELSDLRVEVKRRPGKITLTPLHPLPP